MREALDSPKRALGPVVPGTGLPSSWSDAPDLFYQEAELLAYLRSRFEVTERTAFGHSHTPTVTVAAGPSIRELTDEWSRSGGIGVRKGRRMLVRLVEAGYVIRARAGQGKGRQKVALRLADNLNSRSDAFGSSPRGEYRSGL
jgi:hypothetical protein